MKAKLLFITALFSTVFVQTKAQVADVAIAKAFYTTYYVDDTTQRTSPQIAETVLYLGEKGSIYRRILDEESKPLLHMSYGGTMETFDIIEESASQIFLAGKSHRVERVIDNKYIITEDKPVIDWELGDETKMIGGYNTQKATAKFGGRVYTAWFAADIPFSYGPWKLQGLPGLILEARDSKNDLVFEFTGFQTVKKEDAVKIAVPKSFKFQKVTHQQFEKIYVDFIADPLTFMRASLGLPPDSKAVVGGPSNGKKYNNPREIRDK